MGACCLPGNFLFDGDALNAEASVGHAGHSAEQHTRFFYPTDTFAELEPLLEPYSTALFRTAFIHASKWPRLTARLYSLSVCGLVVSAGIACTVLHAVRVLWKDQPANNPYRHCAGMPPSVQAANWRPNRVQGVSLRPCTELTRGPRRPTCRAFAIGRRAANDLKNYVWDLARGRLLGRA